jgi:hypothetical protein
VRATLWQTLTFPCVEGNALNGAPRASTSTAKSRKERFYLAASTTRRKLGVATGSPKADARPLG